MDNPQDSAAVPALLRGPKRQHYLPQFYLNGFCRNGRLWLYDRARKQYRQQQPKDTGLQGHLYTVRDEQGRQRFEIEAMLSKVEGAADTVMRKLEAAEPITEAERAAMAEFVGLAFTRTPERLGEFEALRAHVVETTAKLQFGTVEGAAKLIEEIGEPAAELTAGEKWGPAELAEQVNNGLFKAQIAHEAKLADMLKMTEVVVPILGRMIWIVLHAERDDTTFVTTDSPIRLLPPEGLEQGPYGVGFAMRGTKTLCQHLLDDG